MCLMFDVVALSPPTGPFLVVSFTDSDRMK